MDLLADRPEIRTEADVSAGKAAKTGRSGRTSADWFEPRGRRTRAEVMPDLRARREQLGLTQEQFWSRVGVTQSAGSRYESGTPVPWILRVLILLGHDWGVFPGGLRSGEVEAVCALRETDPARYQALLAQARAAKPGGGRAGGKK